METHVIEVEKRDGQGKGDARKLRIAGRLPAVVYGHKEEPVTVTLNPILFERVLRGSGKRRNTLLELSGMGRKVLALAKDIQIDPVSRQLLHVDLLEVREGDRTVVDVPVVYQGRPEGVSKGGKLEGTKKSLKLDCSPLNIPVAVELDIAKMQIGDAIRVKDLVLPEGVTAITDPVQPVATVKAPREAKAAEEEEAKA